MSKPTKDRPFPAMPNPAAETADDLVLRVAQVADLAAQCDREGNPATAVALRRVAEALWGGAFRDHPKTKSDN